AAEFSKLPHVTLIIACYNEEKHIERKLLNSFELDYPKNNIEILVFSDGSTDATDAIVEQYEDRGVRLVRVAGRLGKTHCQNELASIATGDVLVFSDANTMYESSAIREFVKAMAPPDVGVAIGRRVYNGKGKPGNQEGLYERLENWMKERESLLGGTIGANGSMYAVKAKYYVELPIDRMSDIVEPWRVAAIHDLRIIFVSDAIGTERHDNDFKMEFRRKRRIVLRAMNSLWSERLLLLKKPALLLKLIFHKVIRWFTLPLLLVGCVAALGSGSVWMFVLGFGVFFYLLASASLFLLVWLRDDRKPLKLNRISSLLLYAFGVFLSAAFASWDFLRGRNIRVWESRA
ncbi:MAG: glycosyltransferase family 2 protein, partial [Granulosicoccaceae bacterium]